MPNTIVNTIYGQRFSRDNVGIIGASPEACPLWLLPEVKLHCDADMISLSSLREWRLSFSHNARVVAVLDINLDWMGFHGEEKLGLVADLLLGAGVHDVVVSVDEDNHAVRALSPRLSDESSRNGAQLEVSRIIGFLRKRMGSCLVALTVEELCPGGMDATDGVALARSFVDAGATGIIGSGGTVDFAPLKYRRPTQQKNEIGREFHAWPETWLASAQWLIRQVDVPIYAQGFIQNPQETMQMASELGMSGIINVSVKHPSSSLSMVHH